MRYAALAVLAVFLFLISPAQAKHEPGPTVDETWECQGSWPWEVNPLFMAATYTRKDDEDTEYVTVLMYPRNSFEDIVMKAWGKRLVDGVETYDGAFIAMRLEDDTWAISDEGGGFDWARVIEDNKLTLSLSLTTQVGKKVERKFVLHESEHAQNTERR